MREHQLSIHSENILPIIKKWLYSDKEIFLRELVSNASDALKKLKILQADAEDLRIDITIDKSAKTITICDTGIGMTEEEVEKYIAQIAFSGAEEFAKKFSSETEKDPIIGHFGLGFYSSYMVASKVEIDTLSHRENAKSCYWACDGSSSYTIGAGKREKRGTAITLHLDEDNLEYLEEKKIKELLVKYCNFFPFPIFLSDKSIENKDPLWLRSPSECTDKEYIDFYRSLFPLDPEPIFWIHLNVDYPFHLQGILYFPTATRRFGENETSIKLYSNRVFVSEGCKDILPDFLTMLKGAIDSPDIPLNVSRSYLQVDKNVRQLSAHIAKKVADKLLSLYKADPEKFISSWPDVEMIVKLGLLQEEKFFEKAKGFLIWKNSEGKWDLLPDKGKIFYSSNETSPLIKLYKEPVVIASNPIDNPVIQKLEEKLSITFQRIDGAIDDSTLDASKEKTVLDADGKTEGSRLEEFVRSELENVEVKAKSLTSSELPGFVLIDENQRRFRDYMALTQGKKAFSWDMKKTFVLNTNHKLVDQMMRLKKSQPKAAALIAKSLYELSLLSQRETSGQDLENLVKRQTEALEEIASLL